MGCKGKCVFCAQDKQTGINPIKSIEDLRERLLALELELERIKLKYNAKAEVAFYGGTFTALPEEAWSLCTQFVNALRKKALFSSFRCSTRPDSLSKNRLEELKKLGCVTIELGIQSFNDQILKKASRAYNQQNAIEACKLVKNMGFKLGVQLMPGLMGANAENFLRDVKLAALLNVNILRFYPCLVLKETELARLWQEGDFQPWTLAETLEALAEAWNRAREANIVVSRIGLAPDKNLEGNILAGPVHPALGSRVQALGVYKAILYKMSQLGKKGVKIKHLQLPSYIQGFFWGWQGELKDKWAKLGVEKNISWTKQNFISLEI